MGKKGKLAIGIILLILLVVGIIGYQTVSNLTNEVTKKYGYENEEIIAYVEDKYDIPVTILENEGRKTGSAEKGLTVHDAIVQTKNEEQLTFHIHISPFGNISGDDYEEVKLRHDLNAKLRESDMFEKLRAEGFTSISFGAESEDPTFSMKLPEGKRIGDEEVHESLYASIPTLKKVQKEAEKEDYKMSEIRVDDVTVPLNAEYQDAQDMANKLAADNIDAFTYLFSELDRAKVSDMSFEEAGFQANLTCEKIVIYDICDTYSLTLTPIMKEGGEDEFRYDDETDRTQLFEGIQLSREIELPIDTLLVDNMIVPFKPEDQHYTEEELLEREGSVQVMTSFELEVRDFRVIESADEVYLEYVG
ncbi:hypothetical protein [Oceanobacillus kapialis]|uniref:Uncharacterized protein n=1 Tax=Oceanobacillus kapialis TaxID=481353 RepID=A0ABW5Q314_9BACI